MRDNIVGIVVWVGLWFFLIVLGIVFLIGGASDIVVDNNGIYRELYGHVWKTLHWNNISHIDSFRINSTPSRKSVMAYNLFPIVKPKFRLFPSGKMWFLDNVEDVSSLLEVINLFAGRRNIKMRVKKDGRMIVVNKLEVGKV